MITTDPEHWKEYGITHLLSTTSICCETVADASKSAYGSKFLREINR